MAALMKLPPTSQIRFGSDYYCLAQSIIGKVPKTFVNSISD